MSALITTDNPDIFQLCQKYWAQDEEGEFTFLVADLQKEFGLTPTALALTVRKNSYMERTDIACATCRRPHRARSRRELLTKSLPAECKACKNQAEEEKSAAIKAQTYLWDRLITEIANSYLVPLEQEKMTMLDSLNYFVAVKMVRLGGDQDANGRRAPRLTDALAYLLERHWITPCVSNYSGAAPVSNQDLVDVLLAHCERFHWRLSMPSGVKEENLVAWATDKLESKRPVNAAELAVVHGFADKLAVLLAEKFLLEQLDYVGLRPILRSNARPEIIEALRHFNVGQVFNLLWGTCRSAARYGVTNKLSREHVLNAIGATLKSRVQTTLNKGWEVSSFTWPTYMPMGAFSEAVFVVLLDIVPLDWRLDKDAPSPFEEPASGELGPVAKAVQPSASGKKPRQQKAVGA